MKDYIFRNDVARTPATDAVAAEEKRSASVADEVKRHSEAVEKLNNLHDAERQAFEAGERTSPKARATA